MVITADHGMAFFEHGDWGFGEQLYKESLHVPLIMRLPGVLPENTDIDNQVRTIDILPTMMAVLDIPTEHVVQGVDLIPLLRKEKDFNLEALSEAVDMDDSADRNGEIKSFRTARHTLIFDRGKLVSEFFDLVSDPGEQFDIMKAAGLTDTVNRDHAAKLMQGLSSISAENRSFYEEFDRESTYELDEEMIKKLKALGYVQ